MRQGEGADLLGVQDPRGESIGIIYVAPTDDRQSVLTAILTQDRLGRKQVAVVLPENNRAFQRPVDFDGLKNMRRGLKSEIVFVAPNGPGPAEFARQRRFPVYTSLDNYASAIRAQAPEQEVRRGWFGRRQKPVTGEMKPPTDAIRTAEIAGAAGAAEAAAAANQSALQRDDDDEHVFPLPATYPPKSPEQDEEKQDKHANAAPIVGAAGAAGILGAATFMHHDDDSLAPPPSEQSISNTPENAQSSPPSELNSVQGMPPAARAAEPGIISFSEKPRPRTTAKLPASSASSAAGPNAGKNGATGKRAALVAGTTAAGAGIAASAFASTRAPARTFGAQPGGPGGPGVQSPGGPGSGNSGTNQPRRRNRRLLALLLALLTLLLLIGIVFASPLGQQVIPHIVPGSTTTATVTITPKSKDVADKFIITAITGTPNPSLRQVQARIVSVTSASKSASAHATGSIPGRRASGTLQFINLTSGAFTVTSGTVVGADGVVVAFNAPLTVPLAGVFVTGTAVNVGTSGNIGAFDINHYCCNNNIFIKNPSAFSGGQNPQPNSVITQNDINSATNTLIAQVKPEAQSQLKGQVRANEDVVPNSLNCTPNVKANHAAGDVAPTVTVTGTATCSEEVYDRVASQGLATTALKAEAAKDPGPGYAPVNNDIVVGVIAVKVIDNNHTVQLQVHAEGVWVYQFSDQLKQRLADAIANKSKSDALAFLQATTGISAVSISISSGDTLPAANDITIIVKAVPGPSGTPTLIPSSPTPITTPTTIPTAQNGQGGS